MATQVQVEYNPIGFVLVDFPKEILKPIFKEVNKIQKDFKKAIKYNNQLAGNIEHEYALTECKPDLEKLFFPVIQHHMERDNYIENLGVCTRDINIRLDNAWVNFQKKYEFNPIHNHSGVFSFVIWLKAPYSIYKEMSRKSSINSNSNSPAHFSFHYTNSLGTITTQCLPVDKDWECKAALFPSSLSHSVNPFFTSDKYRISVSGNFKFDVGHE